MNNKRCIRQEKKTPRSYRHGVVLAAAFLAHTSVALAQDAAPTEDKDAAAPLGGVKISGYAEVGFTGNFSGTPGNGVNYGHLFTDKANQPVLNQAVLTISRDLDPKAEGFDWGFKVQPMIGADARYTHFLGEADTIIKDRTQIDVVEANVQFHLPVVLDGGIDLKIGQYATPLGAEVISAPANALYSHSYIFNFGLPLKHTGVLATAHVTPVIDLYGGVDSGVNTSLTRAGDNNSAAAAIFGFGLNLYDGALSVLALTHAGPENPGTKRPLGITNANGYNRWINDVTIIYKQSEDLTLTSEFNYIKDDAAAADGYGFAQYATLTLTPTLSTTLRGEVWRDSRGYFVAAFPGNQDFVKFENGLPTEKTVFSTGRGTTYSELTLGVTWKPEDLGRLDGLTVRPELRYDHSYDGVKAFYDLTKTNQVTFSVDLIVPFGS